MSTAEQTELAPVTSDSQAFELAQRKAKVYANSTLVPKEYQGNVGNVLVAQNMATRMGADLLMVMQNLYIVHGKPGWSSQFLIACFNQCGRFSTIKYKFVGEHGKPTHGCIAYATELETGEVIEGPCVTMKMATDEGWIGKPGSKWKAMPGVMMRYRAATFLVRCTAPEIGMGLHTRDELEDIGMVDGRSRPVERTTPAEEVAAMFSEPAPSESREPSDDYSGQIANAESDVELDDVEAAISGDPDLTPERKGELRKLFAERKVELNQ